MLSLLNVCGIDKMYVQCMKKNVDWHNLGVLLSGDMFQTV